MDKQLSVLGLELVPCSAAPLTGFKRDGLCVECIEDGGRHTVCAVMTDDFLQFSRERGNDLTSPRPEYGFAGLVAGDYWCVCAGRWVEALRYGVAPPIVLAASHESILEQVSLETLVEFAIDRPKRPR